MFHNFPSWCSCSEGELTKNDRPVFSTIIGAIVSRELMPHVRNILFSSELFGQRRKPSRRCVSLSRRLYGVTKLDGIRNERIRGKTKVGVRSKKLQERRLQWHGHLFTYLLNIFKQGRTYGQDHCFTMLPCTV